MKHFTLIAVLTLFATVSWCPLHATTVYDVASDFSATSNPNGVWSYGYTATLGGSLTLLTTTSSSGGVDFWSVGGNAPVVGHNSLGVPASPYGGIFFAPDQFGLHPGSADEKTIARFTAPASDSYLFSAAFSRIDVATTDVHVLRNGVSLFDGTVDASGGASYSNTLFFTAGDTLDFAVGYGGNGYGFDMTGLAATVTQTQSATPEPATWAMTGLGALTALLARRSGHR